MSAIRTAAAVKDLPTGSIIQTKYVEELTEPVTTLGITMPPTTSKGALLFTVSLTPLLSTSKILLRASGGVSHFISPVDSWNYGMFNFFAGSTFLASAQPGSYSDATWVAWDLEFLYTPGAGATTYTVRYGGSVFAGHTLSTYVNGYNFGNTNYKPVTSFTVQEVKQ